MGGVSSLWVWFDLVYLVGFWCGVLGFLGSLGLCGVGIIYVWHPGFGVLGGEALGWFSLLHGWVLVAGVFWVLCCVFCWIVWYASLNSVWGLFWMRVLGCAWCWVGVGMAWLVGLGWCVGVLISVLAFC